MFKCWIYIAGDKESPFEKQEYVSEKNEVYLKKVNDESKNDRKGESGSDSYVPGMSRFGFFDRYFNFT